MRGVPSGVMPRLLWMLALLAMGWSTPSLAQRTAVTSGQGLYPRLVRLSNNPTPANNGRIVVSATSFPGGVGEEQIYASDNGGVSFTRIGTISDPLFTRGLCCGGLYELPRAIGAMPAGTLLWAGSVGGDTAGSPMQIRIYRSSDRGATWSYLSNCATGTVNRGTSDGLWEPEFTIAGDGSLVCYYSDETVAGYSQMIQRVTSTDGITWSAPVRVIASNVANDRPGMPVVTKLPSGRYFMTFELCGPAACTVFSKTSPDGLDWGDVTNVGTRVETEDGHWFLHTPTNTWAAVPGTPNGRIFVNGQILSGKDSVGNGRTVFYNDSADGTGKWKTLAAPVAIQSPSTTSNVCQNYSSPLLASADGKSLLGLATDYDNASGSNLCRVYFGMASTTAPLAVSLSAPAMTFAAGQSGSSAITLSPNGFAGTVKLTVSVPNYPGTASFDRDTLTFTGTDTQTATLTLSPTKSAALGSGGGKGFALFSLAGIIPLVVIGALRKAAGMLAMALMLALTGCSGGGGSTVGAGNGGTVTTPPAPSTYTATVTATDVANPTNTSQTQIQVTVNN